MPTVFGAVDRNLKLEIYLRMPVETVQKFCDKCIAVSGRN